MEATSKVDAKRTKVDTQSTSKVDSKKGLTKRIRQKLEATSKVDAPAVGTRRSAPGGRHQAVGSAHPSGLGGAQPAERRELALFVLALLREPFGQQRNDLVQVSHNAEVGDLEDRSVLVLVDSDDIIGFLHSGQVLYGA